MWENFWSVTDYRPPQSYLNSRKEQNILSSIEEGMQRISRDFDSYVAKNVTMEWDIQKERIFRHFGLFPDSTGDTDRLGMSTLGTSTFGRSVRTGGVGKDGVYGSSSVWTRSIVTSILGRPTQAPTGSNFADVDPSMLLTASRPVQLRQQNYAGVVRKLNEASLSGSPYPIMNKLEEVTASSGSDVVSYHNQLTLQAPQLTSQVNRTTHRFLENVGAYHWGRS